MRVPYSSLATQTCRKRLTAMISKQYPLKKIWIVYDAIDRIGTGFTTKDKISTLMKSGVVYEAQCSKCNESYIGKTYRHLQTRINEHLSEQKKSLSLTEHKTQPALKRNKPLSQASVPTKTQMTRSRTGKLSPPIHDLSKGYLKDLFENIVLVDKNGQTATPKSSIAKHYYATGHTFHSDDFKILTTEQHRYHLLVEESILIRKRNPVLNNTDRSIPLYVYPGGINPMTSKKKKLRIPTGSSHTQ